MQKKILFVIEELQTNGAAISLLSLIDAIHNDHKVSLFVFLPGGELMSRIPKDVEIINSPVHYQVLRMPLRAAIKSMLKRFRFDLILFRLKIAIERFRKRNFSLWHSLPVIKGDWDIVCVYCDGFAAQVAVNKIPSGKKLLWIHCDYTKYIQAKETYDAFDKADCAVSVSQDSIEQFKIAKRTPYHKPMYIVHNIIDYERCLALANELKEGKSSTSKCLQIVSVGRITSQKGFDLIPEICSHITNINYRWEIIGEGPLKRILEEKISQKGLEKKVIFIGELSNPMPNVNASDIVVIPSRFEGWGMTLSEALVLGKPVVATDMRVFREQVHDGVNGILVPFNPVMFAAAIKRLATDRALRDRLSREAIKYPYTKQVVKQEFQHVIEEVLLG